MAFPQPRWIKQVPAGERSDATHKFRHRLAMLYACEDGRMTQDDRELGVYRRTLARIEGDKEVTSIPLPRWLPSVPEERRGAARTRFLIRAAALYATEEGTMTALSDALGLHPHTMATLAAGRSSLSPIMCPKIERLCGKMFPKELLNPEVFADA